MAARLTDKQRKRIIADRIDGMSYRSIAAKYGVSRYAVELALKSDPQLREKMTQKKEQNAQDMMAFLESQSESAQEFVRMALDAIKDPAKLQKASVQTIAVALGIVIDKFTPAEQKKQDEGVKVIIDV